MGAIDATYPPASIEDLYRFHVANLRSITRAINEVETLAKRSIKEKKLSDIDSLLRTHVLLLGAWAECRLKKLLYEAGGFHAPDRATIKSKRTQLDQWVATIELGFKNRYGVRSLTSRSLNHTAYQRYRTIVDAVDQDIRPVITLRNKLAHGQWACILTSREDRLSQNLMSQIQNENLLSSKFKLQIVGHLAAFIHDLIATSSAFERDFDKHYRLFEDAQRNLRDRSYVDYVNEMQDRYDRGQKKRLQSVSSQQPKPQKFFNQLSLLFTKVISLFRKQS